MENLLLRHWRLQAGYSPEQAATALGTELYIYIAIENGEWRLSGTQAEQLGKLFNIDPKMLQAIALQLEMLSSAYAMIKRQEHMIEMLTALVKHLKPDH